MTAAPSEPAVKCPTCGAEMPLSSGWGPVGDKQFMCDRCGALTDLVIRV
ncbi:MAG: hypothetical protein JO148_09020 [Acidimicrobiia bacterium]|nr:hypothetical protein [Acidimicrobiia bacterium]